MPRYACANSGCSLSAAHVSALASQMTAAGSSSTAPLNLNGCILPGSRATATDIPMGIWGGYGTYTQANTANAQPVNAINFAMQYQDSSGTWQTYSTWKDSGSQQNLQTVVNVANGASFLEDPLMWAKYDSRTDRFGEGLDWPSSANGAGLIASDGSFYSFAVLWATVANPLTAFTSTLRPTHYCGAALYSAYPDTANFSYTPVDRVGNNFNGYAGGLWSDNIAVRSTPLLSATGNTVNVYYSDPDGVVRRGEGAYSPANTDTTVTATAPYTDGFPQAPAGGFPQVAGSGSGKPIVLSRPFRSVAEMGYAYRDMPYKNLDFFTQESADAALLDVFCLDDVDTAAGKINPTRNFPVLQAMIAGSIKAENSPIMTISATASAAVARALAAHTENPANGPLVNRAELVTKFSNDLTPALSGLGDVSDYYNKAQRESVVRALADVSNTRTWNLMIDVIAQSGRYPPNAGSLNDFVVEGERRYWLHVAIDRYTGKIIDQQLEPVHE